MALQETWLPDSGPVKGSRFTQVAGGASNGHGGLQTWFRVTSLVASPRSAGRRYADAVEWRLEGEVPAWAADLVVRSADDAPDAAVRLALSGLDASVAGPTETRWAEAGTFVVTNASAHRMDADVPLVVPEVNADHLELVRAQAFGGGGAIVANPNCSTIGLVLALAPLHRAFGLEAVLVTTLQAASGAGYPGVASLDLLDNVVPFIRGEEEKLVEEPAKILGRRTGGTIEHAGVRVGAQCFRVPVVDGHTVAVSVRLASSASAAEVIEAWESFAPAPAGLPGETLRPLRYTAREDRPQPRLDRDAEGGMGVTLGRLRECPVLDWRFVALAHNTVRGAAGGALLVAERAVAMGLVGGASHARGAGGGRS
ncbi:MAG: aspartate-semialdehyde dehydrogenase [Planctomycetota bacterium]